MKMQTIADIHDELKEKLKFPEYYGNNLDALWDIITEPRWNKTIIIWKDYEICNNATNGYCSKILLLFHEAQKSYPYVKHNLQISIT